MSTYQCIQCEKTKPIGEFRSTDTRLGHVQRCRACMKKKDFTPRLLPEFYRCTECQIVKPIKGFQLRPNTVLGHVAVCYACRSAAMKTKRKASGATPEYPPPARLPAARPMQEAPATLPGSPTIDGGNAGIQLLSYPMPELITAPPLPIFIRIGSKIVNPAYLGMLDPCTDGSVNVVLTIPENAMQFNEIGEAAHAVLRDVEPLIACDYGDGPSERIAQLEAALTRAQADAASAMQLAEESERRLADVKAKARRVRAMLESE